MGDPVINNLVDDDAEVAEDPMSLVAVPDRLVLPLPADARVLVFSDLHLGQRATPASVRIEQDLVDRLAG